jgi:hypothetical protein
MALSSETTSFTLDNMGRFLCNTLQEARDSVGQSVGGRTRDFDVIIIGGGTFGSVVAEHLFIADTTRSRRILVLEAGPFVLPEHVQNMPFMGPDFEATKHHYGKDLGRGFFHAPTDGRWEHQQDALFNWYNEFCAGGRKPPILIRTSDPGHFKQFLKKLAGEPGPAPIVMLVCALSQIDDGDLRGSGTWSGVWKQAYDYLNRDQNDYLFDAAQRAWRFHIVIPVYEDGVIWIGPNCWPIGEADRTDEFLREDKRPLGKLFMVPGAQPGLSEFEQHSRIIGGHGLLTYAIIEHLADTPGADLAPAIKKGLMRSKRLRSHGYCTPDELFAIEDCGKKFYINYPREIWKRKQREATDLLLDVRDPKTGQNAGPYEVECKVSFPNSDSGAFHSPASLRIFHTIEKKISDKFVASPLNCNRVVGDVGQLKDVLKQLKIEINDDWIKIDGKPIPLDSFAKRGNRIVHVATTHLDAVWQLCNGRSERGCTDTGSGAATEAARPRQSLQFARKRKRLQLCAVRQPGIRQDISGARNRPIDRFERRDF